jgi:hypothetical protein
MPRRSRRGAGDYPTELTSQILLPDPFRRRRFVTPTGPFFIGPCIDSAEAGLIAEAREEKIAFLFAFFQIDPNAEHAWRSLALALAEKHVPAYSARRKQGAPRTAHLSSLCRLYRCAIRKQAGRGGRELPDTELCRHLLKDPQFREDVQELANVSQKRLQNLLTIARSMRRARVRFILAMFKSPQGAG